jgi:predicted acetyltransferase
MTTSQDFHFREPADEDEALPFFQLASRALLAPVAKARAWMEREGLENARLAFLDDRLAGGLSVQAMGQWFGGRSVPCAVVRAVAVAPERRGDGVATRMLRAALLEMRERGLPLSMLFPATQVLYRRAGYEQAGSWFEQSARLADFPSAGPPLPVAAVDRSDGRLRALHREQARRCPGMLDRSEWLWQRVLDPLIPQLDLDAYLIGPDDAPEGYLLVHVERDPDASSGHITLRDRALLTPRAVQRARSFLAQHRSVIERVWTTGPETEPLLVGLPNQTAEVTRRFAWMLRLVDVPAALAARGYPAPVAAELHLAVRDDFLEPHEQRLLLRVRDGEATVERGGRGEVQVDVRGLAALYTGYLSPEGAAALGYLEAPTPGLAALGALFAGPAPFCYEWV